MSAKWTFMVYVAGYNNLTSFAGKDISEMRKVGSGEELKVTVFVKRLEQQAAHRMVIGKDGKNEQRENLGGDVDSGSPQTLMDFIRWSKAEGAGGALRADHLEPRLGLGSARLRRALQARQDRGRDAARARRARGPPRSAAASSRPTIETALTQPNARLRAIASDDGTGHSLDTLELGNVLGRRTRCSAARSTCSAWTPA